MKVTCDSRELHTSSNQNQLSDAEVTQLIQESARQYEEYIRIAEVADLTDEGEPYRPRYAWDNPIGLEITEPSNTQLG